MMKRILTVLASLVLVLPAIAADPPVSYPAGYRNWHHVKSMVIDNGHPLYEAFGGIHHLYANPKAVAGYKSGKFPDGAIIVFDLLEAKSADNAVTEGARKVVGVMHKDAKKYAATGGWGFEGFGGGDRNNRVVRDNAASACFACHEPQKDRDYVFSRLRD
jgi:cytochrome c553